TIHEDGSDFPGETHPAMISLQEGEPVRDVIIGVFNPRSEMHRWVNVNAMPQFKPNQTKPYQVYTTFEDITERKQAEMALRESEEKFRATISQSNDGILITDGDFKIIEWSAAQTNIFGFSREEMLGKQLWEFVYLSVPEEQNSAAQIHQLKDSAINILARGDTDWIGTLQEFAIQDKAGNHKTVQISIFPITISSGNLYGAICRDITKRVQAEMSLKNVNEQLQIQLAEIKELESALRE
ncbi:MAG: PAS domain S-box protein, partial [Hyphomicrobiales bacterium]|nr:PAS domain S-box protein [Hyphomicrobiales bacterium]